MIVCFIFLRSSFFILLLLLILVWVLLCSSEIPYTNRKMVAFHHAFFSSTARVVNRLVFHVGFFLSCHLHLFSRIFRLLLFCCCYCCFVVLLFFFSRRWMVLSMVRQSKVLFIGDVSCSSLFTLFNASVLFVCTWHT